MKVTDTRSVASMLLCVAAISYPVQSIQAAALAAPDTSGCSHLRYTAVPIRAPDGAALFANDLNNEGEVIGGNQTEAFLWKDGSYVPLNDRILAGALQVSAAAINDRSQIVGEIVTPDFDIEEFLLDPQGVTYLVGPFSSPQEINEQSEITGMAFTDGLLHGAVWRNGETVLLPMAPGHVTVNTTDINNKGTVVGFGGAPEANSEALVWFAPYTNAPTIIALPPNSISSPHVAGVNNLDQVIFQVGIDPDPGTVGDDVGRSFVWSADRPLQALAPLPGDDHSQAFDINTDGLIVGISVSVTAQAPVATVWRAGQTCELRDLVKMRGLKGQWLIAFRVNERGEILANLDSPDTGLGSYWLRPTQVRH